MNNTVKVIEIYRDTEIAFQSNDAWVNATNMAKPFGKKINDFLRLQSTRDYITALEDDLTKTGNPALAPDSPVMQKCILVQHGGATPGTWMHPDLAMEFARWLCPKFGVWCNRKIRAILTKEGMGESAPHFTSFLEKVVTSLGNLMETQKQIIVQQGELIKITIDHDRRLSDNAEGYRRLVLGHHTMQARIDAIEAQPQRTARAAAPIPKHQLFTLLDIDRALFTPESADWWVGTSTQLRAALAKTGLHLRQLGLRGLARQYPHRCVDLTSIARGKQRAYAIFRPGFTPDSLAMTLIRQELRNRLPA